MNKKEQIKTKIEELRAELWEIEAKENRARNDKYVGKHFRFRNCYSTPSEKWWCYHKVLKGGDGIFMETFSFQTDCNGKVEIEIGGSSINTLGEPCTQQVFESAWKKTLAAIKEYAQR